MTWREPELDFAVANEQQTAVPVFQRVRTRISSAMIDWFTRDDLNDTPRGSVLSYDGRVSSRDIDENTQLINMVSVDRVGVFPDEGGINQELFSVFVDHSCQPPRVTRAERHVERLTNTESAQIAADTNKADTHRETDIDQVYVRGELGNTLSALRIIQAVHCACEHLQAARVDSTPFGPHPQW